MSLTVHKAAGRARCHYCNYAMALPRSCANVPGRFWSSSGSAPSASRRKSARGFPSARVARVDRDTIRRRGAIVGMLSRFAAGELDVLVGTQMIAKGHDFPSVTLVGVVSADVGLGLADFRAAERTFQLLTQVAGRAGRGDIPGEAIVQTLYPNHYSIRHACRQDYVAFYEEELNYRRAMQYPPAVALINVVVKARTQAGAMEDARDLVNAPARGQRRPPCARPGARAARPAEGRAPRADLHQGHAQRRNAQALQAALASRPELRRRIMIDVDPMSVL